MLNGSLREDQEQFTVENQFLVAVGCTAAVGAVINDALLGDPMAFQSGTRTCLLGAIARQSSAGVASGRYSSLIDFHRSVRNRQ